MNIILAKERGENKKERGERRKQIENERENRKG